ncbi:MAG: SMEK domain-containing protein [Oscillospiraceae bacterium]|nr:SMEK domain-containing protein [Oscillospiraceae bacterium]
MNRDIYFRYIAEKLNNLAYNIEVLGKLNLLDLNIHSETFFKDFLNIIFGFKLENLNAKIHNIKGIDLIDKKNKIILQVSATCTKEKIENSLAKDIFKQYNDYHFIFLAISKDAHALRTKTFTNPYNITFLPSDDIIDIVMSLKNIWDLKIEKLKKVYNFIKLELGTEVQEERIDSNLAKIVNILANENLSFDLQSPEINAFNIDKKIEYNSLSRVQETINEYKIHYDKLDKIYSEFDKEGVNKSISVFHIIKNQYVKLSKEYDNTDDLFLAIVDALVEIIKNSKNYNEIPFEELDMCTNILVVDAFIRCKIFKNPEGYSHVITR